MLKYTNAEKTSATFGQEAFSIFPAENWDSIGNTPTREAVIAWLASTHPEETTTSLIYSELILAVEATYDGEGVELTPYIPEIPPQVIGGGELVIVEVPNVPESADLLPVPTVSQVLAALAVAYKADLVSLQNTWLAAAVADGASEVGKKVQVVADIATRKVQYLADMAAARSAQ